MACSSVLIVEDDRDVRFALRETLETEGYRVAEAPNGKEALEVLRELEHPCLILLDWMMPVMNGHEFLKERKGEVRIAAIPVVIVSAVADRGQVTTSDVDGFVRKPLDVDLLLKVVEQYCK